MQVLLVDDEIDFISILSERLRMRGFQAEEAYDGASALTMIEARKPDIIVLDIIMPEMDGFKVLQKVKSRWKDIPVILLTGCGSKKDANLGLSLGAFDYLIKPVEIDDLIKCINNAVNSN